MAPEFLPVRGGVGTYSVGLVQELSKIADVTVLTLTRSQGPVRYRRADMEAAVEHRARVIPIADAQDTFLYNAAFQIALLRRLPSIVRRERFDVVHSQHAHMPDLLAGPLIPRTPIVRTVHSTIVGQREAIRILESLGQSPDVTERWQIALEPVLRAAERSILHRPGWLLPVCGFTAAHLAELGIRRDRIHVIHNGVDADRFRPPADGTSLAAPSEVVSPRVLFVGRFTMHKGIGTMIGAIPRVLKAVPEVRFQFTGRLPAQFHDWFAQMGEAREHLDFLGYVPEERLPVLYSEATVAVVPSLYDSFPFSVLEAMAAGAPIVASRVGGIPEAIADGEEGVLVAPGSPEALANAIIGLLNDPERRRRLGARARERATTEFTWAKAARTTLEMYRRAVEGP